ncbi:unnamed protein product [Arabidopsis thaliana]|uniref:J domain-containing protein n=1 Tax=Arabidopsis thaliana TaxID=3702 RepID=A0A654FER2_ARATH|nr:unnamed protein product [Arabidopsis thaliana]
MECNKEDAIRASKIAEEKMEAGDFVGAHKFVTKAQRLFPNLENIVQMMTICDVHSSAIKKIKGLDDWYGVLQVQPYADADTIKKQYRKLALLLHPDKNKFAGAEAAFKLVGEANRLLSDQIKRSQYDNRYRSHSMFANRHVNVYSGRHCAATNNAAENIAGVFTFWTRCRHCGQCYKYLREYMNTSMHCSSCQKSFVACKMRCDGVPPSSSTAGRKEFQDQVMSNTSRQNASTAAESGSSAADMGKNGKVGGKVNKKNQEKQKNGAVNRGTKKEEGCTENDAEGRKPQTSETGTNISAEMPKADVLKPQHQVKEEPDTSAEKSIPDLSAPQKNRAPKKKRKVVEESSKSFEVDSSDTAGAKTDTNEHNKRKSSRKKPQVSYAKEGSDGDFVSPPNKKTKSGFEFESEPNKKQTAEDNKSPKLAVSGVSSASSHSYKGKAKKNAHSGNEDNLSAKNKVSEGCDGNGEDAALLSKIGRVEKGYKANENSNPLDIPDLEFSVFKVERKTEDFAVNQVWSTTTDCRDGMPRKYARVKKVLNGEFKLRITYLDPVLDKTDESIPVACGKFKNGKTVEVKDSSIFSGQMHHLRCNNIVSIYPRKGEIWAIFREWEEEWNTSLKKHKFPYKYDFVEIVSDFHDLNGVGVAYLGKLKGSVQLFHWEPQHGICQIQCSPKDMLRFSHKVPAVKMTGKEKESVPPNSYELDPAALPKDIFQVDAVDMEMDSEILKGKADGPYKVGAKAKAVQETASSPRKRQKSDDDNDDGVCSNLGEVIGGSNRSHIFSSCEVDDKNTSTKSRKDGESTDVFRLRKSPRLQTIPNHQGDEKKSAKQGNKMNTPKKMDKGLVTDSLGVDEKKTSKSRKNGEATDVFKLRKSPRLQTIPSQQGDEMKSTKQGNKMNTPKKTDKGLETDSLGVRKSPNGIHQPAESQEGESSKKQGCNGEIPSLSKQNDLPTQLGGSTYKSPSTTHVSPHCKTPRRNAFDFQNLRSEDKFEVNQIWAIYSNDNGMPLEYVKIKKIETKPKFVLRGTPTELYPPSTEPVTRTVSCGEFKLLKGRPKIIPHASFSHLVKPFDSSKRFRFKVYPRKGEIWALYKNCDSTEEPDIVEVVEDNCDGEIVKVVALTAMGSSFQRKQGSDVGLIDISKAEMSRFSHQIPAIRHPKKTTRLVKGGYYWELDPIAIPSRTIVID